MQRKIGLCGLFDLGNDKTSFGGQTMKSRNYLKAFHDKYGKEKILILDTNQMKRNIVKNSFVLLKMILFCKTILIMPTSNELKVLLPFLSTFKKLFKYKLFYSVIGGWLPELVCGDSNLAKHLCSFDAVFVETKAMKEALSDMGYENICCVPNLSLRKSLTTEDVKKYVCSQPFRFCTYSRVTEEKGITCAAVAVEEINKEAGTTVCTLDVYGQMDLGYEDEFDKILNKNPYVKYGGILKGDDAIDILSTYYGLLFPTTYPGEGFPGTLVEALKAGLPVIASDWRYNKEIVKVNVTGLLYSLDEKEGLKKSMKQFIDNPEEVKNMRINCVEESKKYDAAVVMTPVFEMINQ